MTLVVVRVLSCVVVLLSLAVSVPVSRAADPAFVGMMALVADDDVAEQLDLSNVERQTLLRWCDDQEQKATDLVLSLKDQPEEQQQRVREFAAESERLGLSMLGDAQRAKLRQIFFARKGMLSLDRADVRADLELSDEQAHQITRLLDQRGEALDKSRTSERRLIEEDYERRLSQMLTREQRQKWAQLAGGPDGSVIADAGDTAAAEADSADTAEADSADTDSTETGPREVEGANDRNDEPSPPVVSDEPPAGDDDVGQGDEQADIPESALEEKKLRFNFRYAPWETVLEWFAEQANLSLELPVTPPGTFNYTDRREYTPSEAIDIINSVLLTRGYTLVRHRRMLMVFNLEDGIPPNLIETVPLSELDDRGKFELISALFRLEQITAEDAENEVRKLLGPQGSIVVLPKTQALLITETGGRLRVIRDLLQGVQKSDDQAQGQVNEFPLEHVLAEEALLVIRQLMGLPEDRNAAADGSLRIATDVLGTRLYVTGTPENVEQVKKILKLVDVSDGLEGEGGGIDESPQLEVYSIPEADPEAVLKVMQTLLAGEPGVRLDIDPKSGKLIALARPKQHATIRATLDQMQRDGRTIEVIQLYVVDPQVAVLAINKLFGVSEEGGNDRAPIVDADPVAAQLLVRATEQQIEQIRALLEKMGESGSGGSELADAERGHYRMIPLTGGSARSALDQLQAIWPSVRPNRIRVVSPSAAVREMRNSDVQRQEVSPPGQNPLTLPNDLNLLNGLRFQIQPRQRPPAQPPSARPPSAPQAPADDDTAARASQDKQVLRRDIRPSPFRFVSEQDVAEQATEAPAAPLEAAPLEAAPLEAAPLEAAPPSGKGDESATPPQGKAPAEEEGPVNRPGADIIVAPGPGGILIASDDLDALDRFEELLEALSSRAATGSEYTVFYLKYARAEVAAELLNDILGGGAGGGGGGAGGGAGGGLFGDLASAALGGSGGSLVGSLLGLGGDSGAISTTGSVTMVADRRLNALVVEGNPTDVELIEQLLQIIDQEASPEDVQTFARPRLIPVFFTSAEEIANVVRQVYASRLGGNSGNARRQPSPEEFIQALRGGGRGRRGGGGGSAQDQEQPIAISVDGRSNSLVVSAPEPTFQEIRALVEQLDQAGAEETETVRVVTLKSASPELVHKAIVSITGANVTSNTSSVAASTGSTQEEGSPDSRAQDAQFREQMRQRIELFNRLQRDGQQGGGFRGRPSGGGGDVRMQVAPSGGGSRGTQGGGFRGGGGQPGGSFRGGGAQSGRGFRGGSGGGRGR